MKGALAALPSPPTCAPLTISANLLWKPSQVIMRLALPRRLCLNDLCTETTMNSHPLFFVTPCGATRFFRMLISIKNKFTAITDRRHSRAF